MRPPNPTLPKACIFCGSHGKLTKEDFFPHWFRKLYPRPADAAKQRLNAQATWFERDRLGGHLVRKIGRSILARGGDLADQTLRVACARCNNGWMSALQERAKPHLLPYIRGEWEPLEPEARKVITSWATMFAMVTEFGDQQSAAIPRVERLVFSRDQEPLLDSYAWAGRLAGDLPYWFHQRPMRLAYGEHDVEGQVNAKFTTITLGRLLLQVYTTTSDLKVFDPQARAIEHGLVPRQGQEGRPGALDRQAGEGENRDAPRGKGTALARSGALRCPGARAGQNSHRRPRTRRRARTVPR